MNTKHIIALVGFALTTCLFCSLPASANSDKPLPEATIKEMQDIVDKAPFRCAFGFMIAKDGEEKSCTLGDQGIFPTASVIKVAILHELFNQFREGTLKPDARFTLQPSDVVDGGILCECGVGRQFTLREMARLMIIVSDNTAANIILDRVGMDKVNARLRSMGLTNTVMRRHFMEDPRLNGENTTTCAEFLKLLRACDTSQKDAWYEEAMKNLHAQFFVEKIPADLPSDTWIAHKTGELDGVRHDVAIILKGNTRLYIVAFTADVQNVWEADRTISKLARTCVFAMP